jgi:hypothetical protein
MFDPARAYDGYHLLMGEVAFGTCDDCARMMDLANGQPRMPRYFETMLYNTLGMQCYWFALVHEEEPIDD